MGISSALDILSARNVSRDTDNSAGDLGKGYLYPKLGF